MAKRKAAAKADDILKEIISEDGGAGRYMVVTDEKGLTLRAKKGHVILVYTFDASCGALGALFDTHGFADYMAEWCGEVLGDYLASATATQGARALKLSDVYPTAADRRELIQGFTKIALRLFTRHLQTKMSQAVGEHEHEILLLVRGLIGETFGRVFEKRGASVSAPDLRKEIDRLAVEIKSERRAFLAGGLDSIKGRPNFELFKEHYTRVLKVWQHAKEVYDSGHPRWREQVIAANEDALDADLLARVSGRLQDLTEDVQAAVSDKGGNSTPSSIALEHAARLCGARHYQYHARTLFRKLSDPGDVIKTKGVH